MNLFFWTFSLHSFDAFKKWPLINYSTAIKIKVKIKGEIRQLIICKIVHARSRIGG